jgi:SAM-dependent methyltransferase
MAEFTYKEIDKEGLEILDVISSADQFNEWMYNSIKPFCKGRVLEIGSGIGNISAFFLKDKFNITLSDIRANYCDILKDKFKGSETLSDTLILDLTDPLFDIKYQSLTNTFDTVFALNVVEHIEDDHLAISNCKKLLTKNGNLIILVPAYMILYNEFDKELEHYRRYNKKSLNNLFINNGFEIIKSNYYNFIGIFGWFFSGKFQKNKSIPGGQMKLYNKLVPLWKIADKFILNSMGLSVVTIGKKNE